MTVCEELHNRGRCRYHLAGVLVAVDDEVHSLQVEHTYWDEWDRLVLALSDGSEVTADRCHLRSPWPAPCCTPELPNEFNAATVA